MANRSKVLRKGLTVLSMSIVVMTTCSAAIFMIPGTVGVARAATGKTYWGLDGYLGNDTIYLTNSTHYSYFNQNSLVGGATSSVAYTYGNITHSHRYVNYSNYLKMSAAENGQYPMNKTSSTNTGFSGMSYYNYNPSKQAVEITFSIGLDGVANVTNFSVSNTYSTYYFPLKQLVKLTVSGSSVPTNSLNPVAEFSNDKTLGLNTSGTGSTSGVTRTQKFENLMLDILGFVPYLGYAIGAYQTMNAIITLLTPTSSSLNTTSYSPGSIGEYFNVDTNNYSASQNVWGSSTNITVYLPVSATGAKISLMGKNIISADTSSASSPNARTYLNYTTTNDAVGYEGTVFYGGDPAPDIWVKLVDQNNGSVFYVKTNSVGQFVFFGPPHDTYLITATANTPWGIVSQSFTEYGQGSGTYADKLFEFTGKVYGQVMLGSGSVSGATIDIYAPNGSLGVVYSGAGGYYSFLTSVQGNYKMAAYLGPYASGAVTDYVYLNDNTQQNFSLAPEYSIIFAESGLNGNQWSITLSGMNVAGADGSQTQYTTGTSIIFTEPEQSSYSFSVGVPSGYLANQSSGSVYLGTSDLTVYISFSKTGYSTTFKESGLPSGVTWYAYMGNKEGSASSGSSIKITHASNLIFSIPSVSVREPNGDTYTYSPSPSSGTATDGGTVSISFHLSEICKGRICYTESINGTTPVLLANGTYELAENITAGTSVEAYNTNSGSFQNATVREVIIDTHSRMVVVNGYLGISYNQSVWTNHGYVTAGSLTVGDRVFDAFTGHYIRVRSVALEKGNFTMYDFVLGGVNDYIAWQYVLEAGS